MKGSDIPLSEIEPKCQSQYKSIRQKKNIDLSKTGDPKTNLLLDLLICQVKKMKQSTCQSLLQEYNKCHSSFMGTGSYKGHRNCEEGMTSLYNCIFP